jgi:hypothetical protein
MVQWLLVRSSGFNNSKVKPVCNRIPRDMHIFHFQTVFCLHSTSCMYELHVFCVHD